jgi:hypothetical protein
MDSGLYWLGLMVRFLALQSRAITADSTPAAPMKTGRSGISCGFRFLALMEQGGVSGLRVQPLRLPCAFRSPAASEIGPAEYLPALIQALRFTWSWLKAGCRVRADLGAGAGSSPTA